MNKRSGIFGFGPKEIEALKDSRPCHNFPDNLNCVIGHFNRDGNLVELETFDVGGENLDTEEIYGTAWSTLIDNVQDHGYIALPGLPEDYLE